MTITAATAIRYTSVDGNAFDGGATDGDAVVGVGVAVGGVKVAVGCTEGDGASVTPMEVSASELP